ncbi:MAG: helix-turn-helix transcriptional regulator [Deltaproteobacteria bacterium]|nr:helix-turn-helix transcriptional regulator [Nannocystaceae bacterium]
MRTLAAEDAVVLVAREPDAELADSPRGWIHRALRVGTFADERVLLMVARAEAVAKEHKLTPREGETLLELLRCDSYEEIVDALGIARSTVCTHAKKVFEKTGTRSRHALTLLVAFGLRPVCASKADERGEARPGRAGAYAKPGRDGRDGRESGRGTRSSARARR